MNRPAVIVFMAVLSFSVISCQDKPCDIAGDGTVEDGFFLELVFPDCPGIVSEERTYAVVNSETAEVVFRDGIALVSVPDSAERIYDIIYPADVYSRLSGTAVLPPGRTALPEGAARLSDFIFRGRAEGGERKAVMKPLTAILQIDIAGGDRLGSLVMESAGEPLSGTYRLDGYELERDETLPGLPFVTFLSGKADVSSVFLSIPSGYYGKLSVRAVDINNCSSVLVSEGGDFKAGNLYRFGTVRFDKDSPVVYAEHFDACVWGGDPVGNRPGYGPDNGKDIRAGKDRLIADKAVFPKESSVPGTILLKTADWETRSWAMSDEYLNTTGLGRFSELFYVCPYQGYIGGDQSLSYSNRPLVYLPLEMDIDTPLVCELSFNISSSGVLESDIELSALHSSMKSISVDGVDLGLSLDGSCQYVTQCNSRSYITALLKPDLIGDGSWHSVKIVFNAFGRNAAVRFSPSVIRGVNNVFYLDDIVVRKSDCESNRILSETTQVMPVVHKGSETDNTENMRLMPTYTSSLSNTALYTSALDMGITHVSVGLPDDRSKWDGLVSEGVRHIAENGGRTHIWSVHLPYGSRSSRRDRDLCVADEQLHRETVRFFTDAIRAVAPLHPDNVLVHCNQTLLFSDGSSGEMMVRSLAEIAPVADSIGAHLVVENMSYGVGADAEDLSRYVDEANKAVSLKKDIRICMDTGHANLYLNTVGNRGNIADWARTAGRRIGDLHIAGNRGLPNVVGQNDITCYDDHLFPGYDHGITDYYDQIGRNGLWGEFYAVLLDNCRYRGPFVFEISARDSQVNGETRCDNIATPWYVVECHDNYIYPEYRKHIGK